MGGISILIGASFWRRKPAWWLWAGLSLIALDRRRQKRVAWYGTNGPAHDLYYRLPGLF